MFYLYKFNNIILEIFKIGDLMSLNKRVLTISSCIVLLGLFTPWDSHRQWNLPQSSTIKVEQTFLRDNSIHIVAKAYSAEESKKYLGVDVLSKGIQPVQLSIQNHSPETYMIAKESVDLSSISASKMTSKLMQSAIPRGIAFKVASLFFWPIMIPGTIDSMITFKSFTKLKKDLKARLVKEEFIAPYSITNRILFVQKDEFKDTFDIALRNASTWKEKKIHIESLKQGELKEVTSDGVTIDLS
ncbi:MAG: hypothetical protein EBZ47_05415 [Chlamydiae bacterium]|nr:hypothetical protein [Chlamydiota bacterium]